MIPYIHYNNNKKSYSRVFKNAAIAPKNVAIGQFSL